MIERLFGFRGGIKGLKRAAAHGSTMRACACRRGAIWTKA